MIATLNLNGDYLSDALAAQVGGIGIAPGANINYATGHGIFEATHGTAPKYADQDKVNPGSVILSGVMMFDAPRLERGRARSSSAASRRAIAQKTVTYDFHRLMDGATLLKCSEFGDAIIANMDAVTRASEGGPRMARPKIALIGGGNIGGVLARAGRATASSATSCSSTSSRACRRARRSTSPRARR